MGINNIPILPEEVESQTTARIAAVVTLWLNSVEEEPLWLIWTQFMRQLAVRKDCARIWYFAFNAYHGGQNGKTNTSSST